MYGSPGRIFSRAQIGESLARTQLSMTGIFSVSSKARATFLAAGLVVTSCGNLLYGQSSSTPPLWDSYRPNQRQAESAETRSELQPLKPQTLPASNRQQEITKNPVQGMSYTESARDTQRGENPNGPGEVFAPGQVLAIVGGEPIFAGDLLLTINEIIQTKASDAPPFVKEKMREQGIRELLPRAIETKMFYSQAVQMLPDPQQVTEIKKDLFHQLEEKQLPALLKKYQAQNVAELDGRLRMLGSSWRAVKEQAAEQEIAKYAITSNIKIDTEISHDELAREYRNTKEQFHLENKVRWEQLMVSFAKYPDRAAAKRRLAEMGNEVVYGAEFAEVAKAKSDGFFANQGGVNDWTKPGSLTNRQLEELLFDIPVGRLSDIIETEQGYHIVRVIERQDEGHIPFAEAQDQLREAILDRRQEAATEKLLKDVKTKVPFEILIDGIEF